MKKLYLKLSFTLLLVSLLAAPAMAKRVFEVDVIPCGASSPANCGGGLPASDPLTAGSVEVDDDNDVRVILKGSAPNTIYTLFVGRFESNGSFLVEYSGGGSCSGQDVGTVTTDSSGNYKGPIVTYSGTNFTFPKVTPITQLNFVFNNPPCTRTQFSTGVKLN